MNNACLLLGGNLDNRLINLRKACELLELHVGKIIKSSAIYETAAWGSMNQPAFLNQALLIKTSLSADEAMHEILYIEKKMGRIRTEKNASRIIDIDILFYNKEVIKTRHLTVPHPEIQNRNFVLHPLKELIPEFEHPVLSKTIKELFLECNDTLAVELYDN
jgi:2-amino-4-hydroxy-6-hydroxymethyldihydropteridine diphosphokinase